MKEEPIIETIVINRNIKGKLKPQQIVKIDLPTTKTKEEIMTDKLTQTGAQALQELSRSLCQQIIIDNVDVSGCGYYFYRQCRCLIDCRNFIGRGIHKELLSRKTGTNYGECSLNNNCYYKQLKRKEQECEEYKKKVDYLHSFLRNKYNYGSFRPMWGAYLLKHLFNEDLGDFFDEKAYEMADTMQCKEEQLAQLKAENEKLKQWQKDGE